MHLPVWAFHFCHELPQTNAHVLKFGMGSQVVAALRSALDEANAKELSSLVAAAGFVIHQFVSKCDRNSIKDIQTASELYRKKKSSFRTPTL